MAKALGGVRNYGQGTPIEMEKVLEVCGFDDALWALRILIEPADKEVRIFVCDCAERVLPLFVKKHPIDKRPQQAIVIARKYANNEVTQEELAAARDAAEAASRDAAGAAARDAAGAAAEAAAGAAAEAAARDAAGDAAWAAAWDAAGAAAWDAAEAAAWDAAWAAAWAAEKEWQIDRFRILIRGES